MRFDAQGEYFGGEVLAGGEAARRAFGQGLNSSYPTASKRCWRV